MYLVAFALLVILTGHAMAAEWTEGGPVGPSVKSLGQCACVYAGAAYLFAATSDGISWQEATTAPWPSQNWNRLDMPTDTAPAAVEFAGGLYLFARNLNNRGKISYASYNGNSWSQWTHTSWQTISSPAVAAAGTKLHLFWRDASNKLFTAALSAGTWSHSAPVGGILTNAAPTAQYFDGKVYLFAVATTGQLLYKRLSDANWHIVSGLKVTKSAPVALAVSNGKLFIFAQKSGIGYYRILDRTHSRDDFLPVDEWVPVEPGRARSSLAAVGFQDTVYLFYGRSHSSAFLPGMPSKSAPYVFVQSATWSTVQIAIVPLAKNDCSHAADSSDFPELVRFADSVYNPLMIRMILKQIYSNECNDLVWNLNNQFVIPGDSDSGTNPDFFKELDDIAKRPEYSGQVVIFITNMSGGGGFSGFSSNYIYHPDGVIDVCNSGGVGSFSPYRNGFAHEIGHYSGLPHTFRDVVKEKDHYRVARNIAEVQVALEAASYDILTFDQDRMPWIDDFGVYDTPPDPLYEANGVSDMKCAVLDSPMTLFDKRTVPPTPIVLVPPRTNLMSYYQTSPTIINKLTRDQGRVVYQGLRRKGIIKN